jgi:hypothetical protein
LSCETEERRYVRGKSWMKVIEVVVEEFELITEIEKVREREEKEFP